MLKDIGTLGLHADFTPFGLYVRAAFQLYSSIDHIIG